MVKLYLTPTTNVEGIELLSIKLLLPQPNIPTKNTAAIAPTDCTIAQTQPTAKRGRGRPRKYPVDAADISVYLQEDAANFNAANFNSYLQVDAANFSVYLQKEL